MKKHAKRLSILLALTLIFTSFEFMGVFAATGDTWTITWKDEDGTVLETDENVEDGIMPTYDGATPTKASDDSNNYTFDGWDPEVVEATADATYTAKYKATAIPQQAPAAPVAHAYASYYAVRIEWESVDNPNTTGEAAGKTVKYRLWCGNNKIYEGPNTSYRHAVSDVYSVNNYWVQAYIEGTELASKYTILYNYGPVRPMRYRLTIKRKGTLKSHAGPKQKYSVKKGSVIYADRFQTGKYIFDYNGSRFQVARTRVGKKAAEYTTGWDYTREEAEHFIRDGGFSSSTGTLIWVNTYTQHVYYFEYSSAGWKCTDDWDCSTGTASTPTPSGTNGLKSIKKKIKKKNGIKWWSTFNGNAALHGRKKGKAVGKPASNGCVRNPDEKAWVVYSYAGKGTRVVIY